MTSQPKRAENKPIQSLLAFILLQLLDDQPMHEQQIAPSIRRAFGIWLENDAVQTELADLESQGFIKSRTNIKSDEPPEPYKLTTKGKETLSEAESMLVSTCKELIS